ILFDILAVVTLRIGEAKEPLFENRIFAIPQRQRKAQALPIVGEAGQTVLAPAVSPRASLIVAEVVPRVAIVAVVFAHSAPLALAQVGAPLVPHDTVLLRLREARHLGSGSFRC